MLYLQDTLDTVHLQSSLVQGKAVRYLAVSLAILLQQLCNSKG